MIAQHLKEGPKAFMQSWNELMEYVTRRASC